MNELIASLLLWMTSTSLDVFQTGNITRPQGISSELLKVSIPLRGDGLRLECLYYKAPYSERNLLGELIYSPTCNMLSETNISVEGIKDLFLEFNRDTLEIRIQGKQKKTIVSKIMNNEKEETHEDKNEFESFDFKIELYNILKALSDRPIKRYTNYFSSMKVPGLFILPSSFRGFDFKTQKREKKSGPSKGEGQKICKGIDGACNLTSEDLCQACAYGFYFAYRGQCLSEYVGFCNSLPENESGLESFCGEYNQFACLRGRRFSGLENICIEGTNVGFCKDGLHTKCNQNEVLVCL